jgi:hypothetical protein
VSWQSAAFGGSAAAADKLSDYIVNADFDVACGEGSVGKPAKRLLFRLSPRAAYPADEPPAFVGFANQSSAQTPRGAGFHRFSVESAAFVVEQRKLAGELLEACIR